MKWEELILNPVPTIQAVAEAAGTPIGASFAAQIWERLDHVNLTGHHRHNYRVGKGIVGDWRNWLTNHHLEILRRSGEGARSLLRRHKPFVVEVATNDPAVLRDIDTREDFDISGSKLEVPV